MGKTVDIPDAIYYNYPIITTEIENWAWHCSAKYKDSCLYHNPSPPPSNQCWGSGKASDNISQINIAARKGVTFSPKSDNIFSMIVAISLVYNNRKFEYFLKIIGLFFRNKLVNTRLVCAHLNKCSLLNLNMTLRLEIKANTWFKSSEIIFFFLILFNQPGLLWTW